MYLRDAQTLSVGAEKCHSAWDTQIMNNNQQLGILHRDKKKEVILQLFG